ncbi:MAG: L-fucose:H+ symporter permease [Rikenellaceae bacterium]
MKIGKQTPDQHVVSKEMLLPFILITSLFALWGFANDITNPMVAAFKSVMEISTARAALIQFAFYGGYATMAIPAALFIQKYSYKKGILLGLGLYATGALLFWPAAQFQIFEFFLLSLYILTFGLAFLETTANPYILSMGSVETSTRRLNMAQAFNPIGSLMGMFVASRFILADLQSDGSKIMEKFGFESFAAMPDSPVKDQIRIEDLMIIRNPYVILGLIVIVMFVVILCTKMPLTNDTSKQIGFRDSLKYLYNHKVYRRGVIAQMFYVGAQIMCWTFIIQYAGRLGVPKDQAQMYNIFAMGMFLVGRFIATGLMKYVNSRLMLFWFGCGAVCTISGAILIDGMTGLYCLMATSCFMSLMFPTIYGIALEGIGEYATLGAAGLVMAIVGGALMPPLQGWIIDQGTFMGLPSENASFILPFICFIMVAWYGYRSYRELKN